MHLIRYESGFRQSRFVRKVSSVAYLMFAASGGFFLQSHLLSVAYGEGSVFMAWFLVVGGLVSAWGSAKAHWPGEFIGIPLLASALTVFSFAVLSQNVGSYPWIAWGNFLLLMAVVVMLAVRWRVVLAIYQAARWTADNRSPGADG